MSFRPWFDLSAAFARKVVFPVWARRDHPTFARYFLEFEQTQFLSRDKLLELQLHRLREQLAHAYENCPFYRRRMDDAGLHPSKVQALSDLEKLPVTTKKDVQDFGLEMAARNFPENLRKRNQTGGSTGSPVQFLVDNERFDSRMASTIRHNIWAGYRPGDWCAYLWGARVDMAPEGGLWNALRKNLLYRRIELNTSSIGDEDWKRFVVELRRIRPRVMLAYAQSAVLFARYVREHIIRDIRFDSMITTSEILFPEQRTLLEETFGGKVFNRYGSREVSVIASECGHHTGLHVNADALLLELVPHPSVPAPSGRVVITDLLNRSMPLIRYEIGDAGRWAENQQCPCGRGLPLLGELDGRLTDFLVLPDGRHLSGVALLTWVFADMHDVRQVQFIQKRPDLIRLLVVPGADYGAQTRAELQSRMSKFLGAGVTMTVEEIAEIPKASSGKQRFIINEMAVAGGQGSAAH